MKAFLREEGGTRSVTEGACATLNLCKFECNALSLSRLRRQLPPGGSLFTFIYAVSIFLTSTDLIKDNNILSEVTQRHYCH